jgi:hypothetical protein
MRKHFPCLITYFLLLPGRNIWSDSDNKILESIQHSDILYNIGLTVHDLVHNATRSLVLCVCFVNRCLTCCTFSFGHCVVFFDIRILITLFGIFKLFCSTYNKLSVQAPVLVVLLPLHNSLSSSDLSSQLSYPLQTTVSLIHFTGPLSQSWHLKCPSSHTIPITGHRNVFANRPLLVLLTVSK